MDSPQPEVEAAVIVPMDVTTDDPAELKLCAISTSPARIPRYQPSVKNVELCSCVDVLVEE